MDEKELVSLHDSGDRTIIVGKKEDGQRLYKVSSMAMSMASPIWKAMFDPVRGFRESNPDVPVELPEDDPDTLLILLKIAHLQFRDVPKSISFNWLVEIAVLCDKYDCVGLVHPYIESWMDPWIDHCLELGYERWLFIAWAFGCQQIFSLMMTSLVRSVEVDSDGKMLNSKNEILLDYMPLGCAEVILNVREQKISKLLDLIYKAIEEMISGKHCPLAHHGSFCGHIQLAFLVKVLHTLQLGSQRVPATKVRASIQDITQRICNFDWGKLREITGQYKHFCYFGVELKPEIDKILEDTSSMTLENYTQRMEEQAKKSGVRNLKVPNAKDD